MAGHPFRRERAGAAVADDAAIAMRLKRGDPAAFEALVRLYGPRLLAVARRLLGNDTDAADAVQDAYLSAFRSIDGFQGDSKLSTWLYRIVVNASLMRLRARKRRERSIDDLMPRYYEDGHRRSPRPAWTAPSETLLQKEDRRAMIREAINQLPDEYRTVLILRDVEGLSGDETAEVLGVRTGAVKMRLHRARIALRELLERELVDD